MSEWIQSVQDVLMFAYAQLIADAAICGRLSRAPAVRSGPKYWGFANMTYRKLKAGEISPSAILRENKLLVTSGLECAYCGKNVLLQWEHIIPRSRGGPDTIDNLVLSCSQCNLEKSTLNPVEWYASRNLKKLDVPRLVMGKLIKLVYEEHKRRGTLGVSEFPVGKGLTAAGAFLVFDFPENQTVQSGADA